METETKGDRNEGPRRKRLLTESNPKESFITASPESTVSSDSTSDRFAKKTRELPNLSDCHSCGVRINYTNHRERLQPLDSMWRVVLLCIKCTKRVKSSEVCTYCFTAVIDDKDCFKCRDCQHSIHKDCVAKHGPGLGFSVCVDCWVPDAVANKMKARNRKSRRMNRESCERAATLPESRVSVRETSGPHLCGEEVEKQAAASAKASENALRKDVVAKNAVELAKGVLSVVASRKAAGSPQKKVVDDEELAFMLHRVINSSPRTSRYTCLMSSYSGENASSITCYSRRRARRKTSLMNSSCLDVPLICYSRRRRKGGMRNSALDTQLVCYSRKRSRRNSALDTQLVCYSRKRSMRNSALDAPLVCYSRKGGMRNPALDTPLVCYSRRRSSSRACSHVRECERFICKLSERVDKHVSISSAGLKASKFGSYAENSLNGKECQESDGERFSREPHRYLLNYRRIGKGRPRPSVVVKDPDCGSCMASANLNTQVISDSMSYGNGNECHEICEKRNETTNRILLTYKRLIRSKPKFSCKIQEFSPPLPSNYPMESTSSCNSRFQPSYKDPACLGPSQVKL